MRTRIALVAILLTVGASGCSALLKFHECEVDSDCAGTTDAGGQLFCSDDHMCVGAIPDYRLCQLSVPKDGQIPSGALVIGGLFRTSGPNDVNDHAFRNAADLATQELISAGYDVAHVVCDTAGDPDQAARAYKVVIDRFGAQVIVGPDTSGEVFAVADVVKDRGVLVMSPSATNPRITDLDDDGLIWRTAVSDNLQAKVLASLPQATARLDIVFDSSSDYAKGLKDAFLSNFPATQSPRALGFTGGDAAGIASVVQMVAADAPAFALLIADFDAPPLIADLAKGGAGLASTQLLMTDSAKKPSLWGQLGGDFTVLGRVRGTGPANPSFNDPSGMAFSVLRTNYKNLFAGEDPQETAFVSNSYDAFYTVAIAALSLPANRRSGKEIAAVLARVSDTSAAGKKVSIGLNDVTGAITTLQRGGTIDLIGTSGPIDFDATTGDTISAPIEIWSIDTSGANPTFKQDNILVP